MVVRTCPLLALTALLLLGDGLPSQVTVHPLEPGTWIFGTWCADLNQDGRKDILLQTAPGGNRQLHLFLQDEKGFSPRPAPPLPVPAGAAYFMAGCIGPSNAAGVLFLGKGVARFHPVKKSSRNKTTLDPTGSSLFSADIFPRLPHPFICYAWRVWADLTGDGRPDLLLPVSRGYRVVSRKKNGAYAPGPILRVPIARRGNPAPGALVRTHTSLPMPSLADLNGDGRTDVMFMVGPRMRAFFQGKKGLEETPAIDSPLPFLRDIPPGQVALDRLALADLNNDGFADILYMRKLGRMGLFGSLRTRISLFMGPFHGRKRPDQILNLSGLTRRPRCFDFDHDGDLDILLGTLKVDAFSTFRRAVGNNVPAVFKLHLFDSSRNRFDLRPHVNHEKPLPFSNIIEYRPVPMAFLHGDFNGDGRCDLLEAQDDSHLIARAGKPTGSEAAAFESSPLFRVKVAYSENLYLDDLSGEGCTDVLTFSGSKATVVLCR